MERVGIGRGKLILFGEHAAVYGYPAIGIPLDWSTRVEVSAREGAPWDLSGCSAGDTEVLAKLLTLLAPAGMGGTISVRSTVPRGVGFGSSAALCVALSAALDDAAVWDRAHRAEQLFHGTPSGIDTGLAVLEGMQLFRPRPPALPGHARIPDLSMSLVVGYVRRSSSTGALVGAVRERIRAGDPVTRAAIEELGLIAEQAAVAVRTVDPAPRLGALAERAQAELDSLGLSTPELDSLLRRGRSLGALGGKLSGAGGGGAFYLLAADIEAARRIAAELLSESVAARALRWEGVTSAGT